jgi:serine-type D-Ala-D-Ala carboxypeptidase/endopeptidase (penicillin-binding protein 4)
MENTRIQWNEVGRQMFSFFKNIKLMMVVLLIFLCSPADVFAQTNVQNINQELTNLLKHDPELKGAIAGVSIRTATTGKILYQYNGDLRLRPASNLKLLTAAAALSNLGENYTFATELLTDGQIVGNMLFGSLYLKGKGDPTLLKADFDQLAQELIQKGISVIYGDLIGDDTWYDNIRYSIDLPWSDEHTYYGAPISALTASPDEDYDAGSVLVEVRPAKKEGEMAKVSTTPKTELVKIVNKVKTTKSKGLLEVETSRIHGTNSIIVEGSIPVHSKTIKEWVSVSNPTRFALDLFRQALTDNGIVFDGEVKEGAAPRNATILVSRSSMPLKDLLIPFMKLSNNVHGEVLVKEMGKIKKSEGSWEKGIEVLESELMKIGLNTNDMMLRDGSGVSHLNLITANEISLLLFKIQAKPWFHSYLRSLPVSGEAAKMVGGSLRHRMKSIKGRVKAKTGTLTSVTSLSGYAETKSGQTIIFSILLNNLLNEEAGKILEDQIVSIIVHNELK